MVTYQQYLDAKDIINNYQVKVCCVCEREGLCQYFINAYYCDQHYYNACTRHNMIQGAPEYMLREMLDKQPDLWNHKKWLRIHEGLETNKGQSNE